MEALHLKERTVQKLAADGAISTVKVENGQTGHKVLMFHAESVASYIKAKNTPSTATAVTTRKDANTASAPLQEHEVPNKLGIATAPRPWLTLDDAAEYSGLTRRWLLEEAEKSPLPGMSVLAIRDMGKHSPGGRWRFHRESLEKA